MSVGKGSLKRVAGIQADGRRSRKPEEQSVMQADGHRARKPEEQDTVRADGYRVRGREAQADGQRPQEVGECTEQKPVEYAKGQFSGRSVEQMARRSEGHMKSRRLPDRELWAAVVPRVQLREIPEEWRGPQYVRPNVSQLAESISRCGILEPLPVVQTGVDEYQLVGGSKRMEVVRMLGIEQVPVVVLPGGSAEEARQLYLELRPFTDAAQDTVHNAKFRTAALFGAQRIPEYLL